MLCTAITKTGRHCRKHALAGDNLCQVHRHGPLKTGKKNPVLSRFPLSTKTGRYSLFKLSDRKKRALVRDLMRGDQDLDLGAETAVARYITAGMVLYLQAHDDLPYEQKKDAMAFLLESLTATARIVAIHADIRRGANPIGDALAEAMAAIGEIERAELEGQP
jgi:hypothetical protein